MTALTAGVQLTLAHPAHAANNMVYITGTELHISGELYAMDATVRFSGGSFVVDNNLGILTGSGCTHGADVTIAVCTGTVTRVVYQGSPWHDRIDYWTTVPAELWGNAGDDELWGGDGDDVLQGGSGNDTLHGWTGTDQLFGDVGNDQLFGEAGPDSLEGDLGADTFSGGADVDCVTYLDHSTAVNADIDGATGDDGSTGEGDSIATDIECLYGGDGGDWLVGSPGDNLIEGGGGADVIFGLGGSDKLVGENSWAGSGGAADWIYGGAGNDWLLGNDGDDQLFGEAGYDLLEGFAGTDHCDVGADGGSVSTCET